MRKVTGYRPFPLQREIHRLLNETDAKYVVAAVGRQFGKTTCAEEQCLWWILNDRVDVCWIAPTYGQCRFVMKEMAKRYAAVVSSSNFSGMELTFTNGRTLKFYSAQKYDNIRGVRYQCGVLDEAAFFHRESWKAIDPIFLHGRKVLMISTPFGVDNEFYMRWSSELESYASVRGRTSDNPNIPKEVLHDIRSTVSHQVWLQEYEAEFLQTAAGFFNNVDECGNGRLRATEEQVYVGVDLGTREDYTVGIAMTAKGEVVSMFRQNGKTWDVLHDMLSNWLRSMNIHRGLIEQNYERSVVERITGKFPQLRPFTTTNASKAEIVRELALAMDQYSISYPDSEEIKLELRQFREERTAAGNLRYSAVTGAHDDIVMAMALSNSARIARSKDTYVSSVTRPPLKV